MRASRPKRSADERMELLATAIALSAALVAADVGEATDARRGAHDAGAGACAGAGASGGKVQ